jgi:hypothetical protein
MTDETARKFQQLLNGELSDDEVEALLEQVQDDEAYSEKLMQWLATQGISLELDQDSLSGTLFQERLLQRINREEVTRSMLRFGISDILKVFTILLKPFFSFGQKDSPPQSDTQQSGTDDEV